MTDSPNSKSIQQIIPGVLLAGLLWLAFLVLREFLLTLIWSFIIAYVSWPAYCRLRNCLHNRATLSATVMTGLIAAGLFLTVYWLADMLKDELQIAYQTLAVNVTQQHYQLPESISRIPWLGSYVQEWLYRLMNDRADVVAQIVDWAKQWLGEFARLLGGVGRYVLKLGVVLVTVFFCFRDGNEAITQLRQGLIQALGKYLSVYLHVAGNTTRAVVYGLVLAALGQGAMAGLGYGVAGVQAPVLFGIVTALLALIPMGATLVWLPLAIMLIATDRLWSGIGLLLWGFLVISTIDNVIRPIVISGASRLPLLVVMFGVLGGLAAFGAVGLFLGPVILSVLLAVWKAWLEQQGEKSR